MVSSIKPINNGKQRTGPHPLDARRNVRPGVALSFALAIFRLSRRNASVNERLTE